MAAVFQNGCYAIRIIMTFNAKSHRILVNYTSNYTFLILLDLILTFKDGLDGPISIYLLISAILKQIPVRLVTQFKSPKIFIDKYILKC